jgi:4-aminobutyrate aminotransferase / (S)-3-amino-2-methylpropionate transaminase / 5-aminovalerate transaminase
MGVRSSGDAPPPGGLGGTYCGNAVACAAALTQRVINAARGGGLLVIDCGIHRNVLRLLAPLVSSEADIVKALAILDKAIAVSATPGQSIPADKADAGGAKS